MLYDVSQISEIVKISKATVYNKLKAEEIRNHVIKKHGRTYIDEEGLSLIKISLNSRDISDISNEAYEEAAFTVEAEKTNNLNDDIVNILKSEVEFLRSQIHNKNEQVDKEVQFLKAEIQNKNQQLDNKDKLLENMQVLLKQQQDTKLLEQHFKDIDSKLVELRTELSNRTERKSDKGFFKFFNRKKD